jgi:hypothetical protein
MTAHIFVEVSAGELIDKLTISEIRLDRIGNCDKRIKIEREYEILVSAHESLKCDLPQMDELKAELRGINEALWEIEDDIRVCEREGKFGAHFIDLARSVYKTNDRRSAVKRKINLLLGSWLIEEKSYAAY